MQANTLKVFTDCKAIKVHYCPVQIREGQILNKEEEPNEHSVFPRKFRKDKTTTIYECQSQITFLYLSSPSPHLELHYRYVQYPGIKRLLKHNSDQLPLRNYTPVVYRICSIQTQNINTPNVICIFNFFFHFGQLSLFKFWGKCVRNNLLGGQQNYVKLCENNWCKKAPFRTKYSNFNGDHQ